MPVTIKWTPEATIITGDDWSVSIACTGRTFVATVTRLATGWPCPETRTACRKDARAALMAAMEALSSVPPNEMIPLLDEGLIAHADEMV